MLNNQWRSENRTVLETFIPLICARLVGDFILQQSRMIREKRRPEILLLHIMVITAISAALLGTFHPPILFAIALTHAAADYVKSRLCTNELRPFILDQAFHVVVILALAAIYPLAFEQGAWSVLSPDQRALYLKIAAMAAGLIASIFAGGDLIEKLMSYIAKESECPESAQQGLKNGGRYIGWRERSLIFMPILAGNPEGVGFLIGAKSILRIGELKDGHDRKLTEYIIIGTMLSFGWGLAAAELTRMALQGRSAGG